MDSLAHGASALRVPSANPPCYVFENASTLARHVAQLVAGIIREELARLGAPPERVGLQPSEMDAVREAANWACEGDLLILLIHEDPDAVVEFLGSR